MKVATLGFFGALSAIVAIVNAAIMVPPPTAWMAPRMVQVGGESLGHVAMTHDIATASSQAMTIDIQLPQNTTASPGTNASTSNGVVGILGGALAGVGFIGFCVVIIAYSRFKGNPSLCEGANSPVVVQTPRDDGLDESATRIESNTCSSTRSPVEKTRKSEKNRSSLCGRSSLSGIAIRVPSLLDHPPETFEMRLSLIQMRSSEAAHRNTPEMTF